MLFGRNITGGAVIDTRKPSDEPKAGIKVSTTDEMDKVVAASVSGLLNETLKARLTGYYNEERAGSTTSQRQRLR